MGHRTVYTKTAKGEEEIATRKYGLSQDLRRVLIFVDGASNVSKILSKGAGLPRIEQCLEELAQQGFVQADAAGASISVKDELVEAAQQILGNDAKKIITKIKDAPESKEGLEETLNSCKKLVRLVIDEKKAEELFRRCSEIIARS